MNNRENRRAKRSTGRPVSKTDIGRGNLIAALIFLIPVLLGAGIILHARAAGSTTQVVASTPADTQSGYATASDTATTSDPNVHEDTKDLKPGDAVVMKDGRTEIVKSITPEAAPDDTQVASTDNSPPSDAASSSSADEWILAPDHVSPPLPNGDPAPLPVAHSAQASGFHVVKLLKTETDGNKIILTGTNQDTGQPETIVGLRGRDTVFTLSDPNKAKLPTKVIQNVKQGDLVATRNPATGVTEFKRVTQTYKHLAYETITARVADAKTGQIVDVITATPEHPFFVPNKGFVPLGELTVGTKVVTRQEPAVVVKSLEKHRYSDGIPVYNFQVQGDHSYFVGRANGGEWVHNSCWPRITPGSLPAEEEGAVTNALQHIDNGTNPPWGGKWGATFKNKGNPLPTGNTYQEYYVPKGPGDLTPWGARRLVVGSDGSAWYTWDHYGTFVQVR